MTTKEWLGRGYRIDCEINQLISERDKAFDLATNTVMTENGEKVQTSKANGSEIRFINYAAYNELLDCCIDELYKVKHETVKVISRVKDRNLRLLLFMRYVRFMKWEDIADTMHFSYYHIVGRLHPKALAAAEEVIAIYNS